MTTQIWHQLWESQAWDWETKFTALDQLIRLETGSPLRDALLSLAYTYRSAGEWTAARQTVDQLHALLHDPASPTPRFLWQLAITAEMVGRLAAARACLELREGMDDTEADYVGQVPAMQIRLARAIEIEAEIDSLPVAFLPVGVQCMPFNLLMRWGFAARAIEGPYTAGIAPEHGVSLAIAERFRQLRDPSAYRSVRAPSGVVSPHHAAYGLLLNHESGPYYDDDRVDRLVALYGRRADAFIAATDLGRAVFVLERYPNTDLERLTRSISSAYPGLRFRILIIDHAPETAVEGDDERWKFVPSIKPRPDYAWHLADKFNSEAGLAYEQPVVDALRTAAKELADAP